VGQPIRETQNETLWLFVEDENGTIWAFKFEGDSQNGSNELLNQARELGVGDSIDVNGDIIGSTILQVTSIN
jgi:hypothetical protein